MLLTPFLIGLAGSLHCMGMCSPLVMAVSRPGRRVIARNLQYNAGRILTYGLLGACFSFVGKAIQLAGIQNWMSIGGGLFILFLGITGIRIKAPSFINRSVVLFSSLLKERLCKVINQQRLFSSVLLGMINGLLPCGMTLIALTYCITLSWPADGFLAMIASGVGTLPAMVGVASISRRLINRMKFSYRSVQTALIIISGMILIGRGVLNSGDHAIHSGSKEEIVVCGSSPAR